MPNPMPDSDSDEGTVTVVVVAEANRRALESSQGPCANLHKSGVPTPDTLTITAPSNVPRGTESFPLHCRADTLHSKVESCILRWRLADPLKPEPASLPMWRWRWRWRRHDLLCHHQLSARQRQRKRGHRSLQLGN